MQIKQDLLTKYNGVEVYLITLSNNAGTAVSISNFGCIIKDILLPADNTINNIVLSYNNIEDYFNDPHYIGCIVGRYANRIAVGSFSIEDKSYQLTLNESGNNNHLHGGFKGFNKKVWTIDKLFEDTTGVGVVLSTLSPHMEEGYPGNLKVEVTYTLTNAGELIVQYKAKTDQPTIINLTNHSYFNLTGCKHDISSHLLYVNAESYTPANSNYIPTGEILPVDGTKYDLRSATTVGNFMHEVDTLNFCLNNKNKLYPAAVLSDLESKISVEVRTTCPGLQLYCGNYLSDNFKPFAGICLEPQYYPDAPNYPNFPSTVLLQEEVFDETTVYKFNINQD